MGEKMGKAPVYFTTAQVRFNPILTLDALVPAIQDRLRLIGFPDYQPVAVAVFNFNMNMVSGQVGQVPVSHMPQHMFGNIERTASFILNQNSLSFRTTDYDVFEAFSSTFMEGLNIVHDIIKLGYAEQVGIRFLDAVLPEGGDDLRTYLAVSVQGLSQGIKGNVLHAFSETRAQSGATTITARTIIQNGMVGFPPDLQPVALVVAERFSRHQGLHAILDTDGSYDQRERFDVRSLGTVLAKVHSSVVEAFKASVTPEALVKWK